MAPVSEILVSLMDRAAPAVALPELLCQDACRRLPISGAGICLMSSDGFSELTVASDDRARELEELQFSLGEGPCIEAVTSGRPVLHTDLSTQCPDRWPSYCQTAFQLGVRAIFSYPLRIGQIRLGVLDLYRDVPGHLDDGDFTLALSYAEATATILLHMQANEISRRSPGMTGEPERTQIESAFDSHPEVHQATGMVSIQAHVGLAEALVLLRTRAHADHLALSDLARDIVGRRVSFT